MLPAERFSTLWRRLGATDDGSVALASLESAYREPHRSYHTASHIVACLGLFDQIRSEAARPDEVEAALWFHDAVYDPRARDNEERTACMACELMEASGIAPDVAGRVADMIRATREHEVRTPDTALVIDVDLAILAAPPQEFARFEAGIKREFEWVEDASYRAVRAAVLRRFLDRPVIYTTPALRDRFEAPARANLRRLIERLSSSSGVPGSGRRLGLVSLSTALLLWGALYVFRTSFVVEGERVFSLWDDAMISMRYGRNLAEGHGLVWNPDGERVQGFSNPAITLAMAALHALPIGPPRVALAFQLVQLAALAAALGLAARAARDLFPEEPWAPIGAALASVLCAPIAVWALQGADTAFVSLWLLAGVAAVARAGPRRWPKHLSAWLALGPLVRPDAAIFSAAFLATSLAYPGPRLRRLLAGGAALAAVGAALLGFGWLYYGDPLPNTYYLKATGSPRALVLRTGAMQLARWLPGLAPALAAAAFAVATRRRDPRLALVALLVLAGLGWSVWTGGDWLPHYGIRYAVPVLPLLLLLAVAGCADLLVRTARLPAAAARPLLLAASAALALAASPAPVRAEWLDPLRETLLRAQNQLDYRHALYLRDHTSPGTTVAVHWGGVLPYFAERPAIDVLGRSDRHIARLRVPRFLPGHSKWDWDYLLDVRRPDVIHQASRGLGKHPRLHQRYVRVEVPGEIEFFLRRTAIPRLADPRARFFDIATGGRIERRPRPAGLSGSRGRPGRSP